MYSPHKMQIFFDLLIVIKINFHVGKKHCITVGIFAVNTKLAFAQQARAGN